MRCNRGGIRGLVATHDKYTRGTDRKGRCADLFAIRKQLISHRGHTTLAIGHVFFWCPEEVSACYAPHANDENLQAAKSLGGAMAHFQQQFGRRSPSLSCHDHFITFTCYRRLPSSATTG